MRVSAERKIYKINQTNSGAKRYNNWTENSLENLNIRIHQAEGRTSKFEDRSTENIQSEKQKEKNNGNWRESKEHVGYYQAMNKCTIRILERKWKKQQAPLKKWWLKISQIWGKNIDIQIQESERTLK